MERRITDRQLKELLKVIRANCIDCMGGQEKEVEKCTVKKCKMYPYRMGKIIEKKKPQPSKLS